MKLEASMSAGTKFAHLICYAVLVMHVIDKATATLSSTEVWLNLNRSLDTDRNNSCETLLSATTSLRPLVRSIQ